MKKVFGILAAMIIVLGVVLGWRIHVGQAYQTAPSGGSGVVEAAQVDLSARLNTRIERVHVREGDRVERGQLLVELDCAEASAVLDEASARLAMAKAAVDAARAGEEAAAGNTRAARQSAVASAAQSEALEAERANAQREELRLTALHTEGAVSDSLFDGTRARVSSVTHQKNALAATTRAADARADAAARSQKAASAQTASAEQAVAAAQAAVRRATLLVRECRVESPIDGVVLGRNYDPGELTIPGAKLLTLVDLRDARATFYLPNAELAVASPGAPVRLVADAWPGETFHGTITRVAAEAEFTPRNVQTRQDRDRLVYAVEVAIPNPDERLRPGMPIQAIIEGTAR